MCHELTEKIQGILLGDKGYIRLELKNKLAERGLRLETPLRNNMQEKRSKKFINWMMSKRRLIETIIGQLTERFHIQKVRARDTWHFFSRFWRKLLAHTTCVVLSLTSGHEPLQFERLINS